MRQCSQTGFSRKFQGKSWTFGNVAIGFSVGRISSNVHIDFAGEKPEGSGEGQAQE